MHNEVVAEAQRAAEWSEERRREAADIEQQYADAAAPYREYYDAELRVAEEAAEMLATIGTCPDLYRKTSHIARVDSVGNRILYNQITEVSRRVLLGKLDAQDSSDEPIYGFASIEVRKPLDQKVKRKWLTKKAVDLVSPNIDTVTIRLHSSHEDGSNDSDLESYKLSTGYHQKYRDPKQVPDRDIVVHFSNKTLRRLFKEDKQDLNDAKKVLALTRSQLDHTAEGNPATVDRVSG